MKKVTFILVFSLALITVVAQGGVDQIDMHLGTFASSVVTVLLPAIAVTLFMYGMQRLIRRRRAV